MKSGAHFMFWLSSRVMLQFKDQVFPTITEEDVRLCFSLRGQQGTMYCHIIVDKNNYRLYLCSTLFEESPDWFCSHLLAMTQACTHHSAIIVKSQQWPTPSESIAIYCIVRKLVSCVTHRQPVLIRKDSIWLHDRDFMKQSETETQDLKFETETRELKVCDYAENFPQISKKCYHHFEVEIFRISGTFPICFGCVIPQDTAERAHMELQNFYSVIIVAVSLNAIGLWHRRMAFETETCKNGSRYEFPDRDQVCKLTRSITPWVTSI